MYYYVCLFLCYSVKFLQAKHENACGVARVDQEKY